MDTRDAGKMGGETRARNMTPEQRSEAARRAAYIRWALEKRERKGENDTAKPVSGPRGVR